MTHASAPSAVFIAPVVRFAPSPTGRIHIGNARTAMLNYFFARKHGGTFLLRFDDTDSERSTEEYALGIEVDLAWLGVAPDKKIPPVGKICALRRRREEAEGRGAAISLF